MLICQFDFMKLFFMGLVLLYFILFLFLFFMGLVLLYLGLSITLALNIHSHTHSLRSIYGFILIFFIAVFLFV